MTNTYVRVPNATFVPFGESSCKIPDLPMLAGTHYGRIVWTTMEYVRQKARAIVGDKEQKMSFYISFRPVHLFCDGSPFVWVECTSTLPKEAFLKFGETEDCFSDVNQAEILVPKSWAQRVHDLISDGIFEISKSGLVKSSSRSESGHMTSLPSSLISGKGSKKSNNPAAPRLST